MVLTSTHNLCLEKKYEKYQNFLFENFSFMVVRFSVYLNRRGFVMPHLELNFMVPKTFQPLKFDSVYSDDAPLVIS